MTAETRNVVVRLSMEASNYIANAQKAGKVGEDAMQRVQRATLSADQAVDRLGNTSGKIAAGGIAALLATGNAAIQWESQWAGVTKTVDGTTTQMAELEDGLRDLATTLPATHQEIAGVAEAAGQLGVAREDIVDFTRTMVDLGETTNLTAEQAATDIAQMANVMGTTGDEVDNLGAALVALGNDGASTEAQILGMAQRIAGAGAQIGLAESDILAIANAAASMGIEVEAGGSAVSRVFTELAKATATGGADLDTFAQVAGMSSQKFVAAFQDDPARAFASFTEGLDRINKSGGDVFTVLDDLGLADVRVSQALLGMAASGDLLTDSLDLGAQAWEENTALAIEAAKRYDTTASEVQVSWNKIRDAGIDAGETLLPVASEIADKVGSIADAFGSLPAPVQGAFVELLGIGTLVAGAGWLGIKTVTKVNSAREALADLETQSPKTAKAVTGIGKAAGIATVAIVGLDLAISSTTESDPVAGLETTTRAILDMANGADGAKGAVDALFERESTALGGPLKMTSEIDGLRSALDALQTGGLTKLLDDPLFMDSDWDLAAQSIDQLDSAMSNLVQTGNAEAAAEMYDYFAQVAKEAGLSTAETAKLLPGYSDALVGLENESRRAAEASEEQAAATDEVAAAMSAAEDAAKDFKDLIDSLNAVLAGRGEMRDYEAAIDDFTEGLKENGNTFDINTAKGRENQAMLDGIASSAIAVADEMSQTDRRKFLSQAIVDLRKMGEELNLPKTEIKALIELLRTANKADVNPKIDADTRRAMASFREVDQYLSTLDGKRATTYVDTVRTITGPKGNAVFSQQADGSVLDFFANGGMRENHVAQIAPGGAWRVWAEPETGGEAYIPLAPSKRERSIDIWEEVGSRLGVQFERYARGGTSGRGKSGGGRSAIEDTETEAERRRRERREAIEEQRERDREREAQNVINLEERRRDREAKLTEAMISGQEKAAQQLIDAAQAQLTAAEATAASWEQAMQRTGQAATAGFQSTLFGGSQQHGLWVGGSGVSGTSWRDALMKDIAGLTERQGLIGQLSAAGLSGAALEALLTQGSNADISALLASGDVGDFGALYNQRAALTGTVQGLAGQAAYGAEYATAMAAVGALGAQVLFLSQQLTAISAQRPINVSESVSAYATAQEIARLQSMMGAA